MLTHHTKCKRTAAAGGGILSIYFSSNYAFVSTWYVTCIVSYTALVEMVAHQSTATAIQEAHFGHFAHTRQLTHMQTPKIK